MEFSSSNRTTTPRLPRGVPQGPRRDGPGGAGARVAALPAAAIFPKEPRNQTWNALAPGLRDHGYVEGE